MAARISLTAASILPRSTVTRRLGGGGAWVDAGSPLRLRLRFGLGADTAVDRSTVDRCLGRREGDRGQRRHGTVLAREPLRPLRQLLHTLEDLGELVVVERLLLEQLGGQ